MCCHEQYITTDFDITVWEISLKSGNMFWLCPLASKIM